MTSIAVPISIGELFDKVSILKIKRERIADAAKLANVERELALLEGVAEHLGDPEPVVLALITELKAVNETIWDAENLVREFERDGEFGRRFVENARATYRNNDRRAQIKRRLNDIFGSALVEEKSHVRSTPSG